MAGQGHIASPETVTNTSPQRNLPPWYNLIPGTDLRLPPPVLVRLPPPSPPQQLQSGAELTATAIFNELLEEIPPSECPLQKQGFSPDDIVCLEQQLDILISQGDLVIAPSLPIRRQAGHRRNRGRRGRKRPRWSRASCPSQALSTPLN